MPAAKSVKRKVKPARAPHRLFQALLGVGLVAAIFATLMTRLGMMREGYRLSDLRAQIAELKESNRTLKLRVAELASHDRLRALAVKYRMTPPARGQVVVVP
jgi:cell division protein FtsL